VFVSDDGHFLKPLGSFWPWFLSQRMVIIDNSPIATIGVLRSKPRKQTPCTVFICPHPNVTLDELDLFEIISVAHSNAPGTYYNGATFPFPDYLFLFFHGMFWYSMQYQGQTYNILLATDAPPDQQDKQSSIAFVNLPFLKTTQRGLLEGVSERYHLVYEHYIHGMAQLAIAIPGPTVPQTLFLGANYLIDFEDHGEVKLASMQ
jgi:hypothetical protein